MKSKRKRRSTSLNHKKKQRYSIRKEKSRRGGARKRKQRSREPQYSGLWPWSKRKLPLTEKENILLEELKTKQIYIFTHINGFTSKEQINTFKNVVNHLCDEKERGIF